MTETTGNPMLETLWQYLQNDFPAFLKCSQNYSLGIAPRDRPAEQTIKQYRWAMLQRHPEMYQHAAVVLPEAGEELEALPAILPEFMSGWGKAAKVTSKVHFSDEEEFESAELTFTRSVYLYTDRLLVPKDSARSWFTKAGLKLLIRDDEHRERMQARKKPDAFVCHDSRDKDAFVRPLVDALRRPPHLLNVFYDEFSIEVGDSLVAKIDEGLATCRYGIVVISKNFLTKKKWTAREFHGLTNREVEAERKMILPIWLDVTRDEVSAYSPPLADKLALMASEGVADGAHEN